MGISEFILELIEPLNQLVIQYAKETLIVAVLASCLSLISIALTLLFAIGKVWYEASD